LTSWAFEVAKVTFPLSRLFHAKFSFLPKVSDGRHAKSAAGLVLFGIKGGKP
jgi:hypothetical protein